jgi:FG-GAP-like repeat
MSNKRKKDRNKIDSLDLSATGDTNPSAIVSREIKPLESQSSKGGLLARLKAHWLIVGIIAFLALGALGAGLKYLEEDARRQMLNGKLKPSSGNNESLLNSINPFLPAALPNPTPQLSKEYIYAGERLLAVEDANATAVPPADLAVWRPSTGGWYVMGASGVMRAAEGWGTNGDIARPGDYDGDGKTDFCVFRPSDNIWYIRRSSNGGIDSPGFGIANDIPAPADFDGDGITDVAVLRKNAPSSGWGTWYVRKSSDLGFWALEIEIDSDTDIKTIAPADYDGDGKADVAVWRKSIKSFRWRKSSNGQLQTLSFAGTQFNLQQTSQEPVSGDYDGDGKADFAVRDGGNWVILKSSNGAIQTTNWGLVTDKAVHNDYDADGKVDIGVFRDGAWYISNSSGGTRIENWGQAGDTPVPVFYRR